MATEKWAAGFGVGLTWTDVGVSTTLNSLADGNAIICSSEIDNSSALDLFMDLSCSLGSITPGAGAPFVGIFMMPTNQDGTTWGDGRFASAAAGPPPSSYLIGAFPGVPSTAGIVTGIIQKIELPPAKFKLVAYNKMLVALASSGNVLKYRTYIRAIS